ncbi:hypothetical protein HER10_EVM0006383 [Colletotrichum scovillei]|uniref:N-acetyltransferase domain-containing protein n=1 Tax=Colletotrichum scovillei TaxID=1209932 RepID=A0A9P7R8R6_9PEZI|nr:uncharacterized protein HER10_EVM0006383 [Colletotrichum scovillei]KAF4783120.1 hypothetical protein HER10_EVM0006383 [Colletotrichum scovillei]KAG7050979.1 hypothetical protein JMJ77_0001609 [Colletotrichum scovillei]KAG7070017.1 hypothetical protein JMJ76_0001276 [Colletotrichum scovillei]KAG7078286.1 hypothetical protein JMJ78_0001960 [Colletotrichum scovillei]
MSNSKGGINPEKKIGGSIFQCSHIEKNHGKSLDIKLSASAKPFIPAKRSGEKTTPLSHDKKDHGEDFDLSISVPKEPVTNEEHIGEHRNQYYHGENNCGKVECIDLTTSNPAKSIILKNQTGNKENQSIHEEGSRGEHFFLEFSKEPVSTEKRADDIKSQCSHDEEHRGEGISRVDSPYPWSSIGLYPQEAGSARFTFYPPSPAVIVSSANGKAQATALSSSSPSGKLTQPIKRSTSIRWAMNLPVPQRRLTPPAFLNDPTSSPEARRISFEFNTRRAPGGDIYSAGLENADYDYLAERRAYVARSFERTRRQREAKIAAQRLKIQSDADDDENNMMAATLPMPSDYIPPHKRLAKTKAKAGAKGESKIEDPVTESQEPATTTSYYAESDTASSTDDGSSRVPLSGTLKKSAPLTPMALENLPERMGVTTKSKKSHSSWDVSNNDRASSGQDREDNNAVARSEAKVTGTPSFLTWLYTLDGPLVTSFLNENQDHHYHDVSTDTGKLIEHIEQPPTKADIVDEKNMTPEMIQRRREWTSNLLVHREIMVRQNMAIRQRLQEEERAHHEMAILRDRDYKRDAASPTKMKTAVAPILDENSRLADCVLRPAQPSDAEACAEMYNLAVGKDPLVTDTYPVSVERFEYIMIECKRQKLPFIVATTKTTDLTDPGNWPSRDAYRQYMKWMQSQPTKVSSPETTVYGFAYLRPYETGIGGLTGNATPTVKATIFVHPEHRRGRIGSALLHQLLSQVSILYHGFVECQWADPKAGEDAFYKPDFRNIHRVVVHTMAQSEGGQGLKWMDDFMSSFQFEKAGRLNQVYKVKQPHGADWYDQVIWQHWANKIPCKTFYVADDSECSYDYPGKRHSPGARRAKSPDAPQDQQHDDGSLDSDSDDVFGA